MWAGNAPILVNRGKDPSVLVIAFTGRAGLMMRPYDFMDLTGAVNYSHILLRDPADVWYHAGLDGQCSDFPALTGLLQSYVRELEPQKIIMVGSSAGGYAALLAGYLMKADYVHALGPQTYMDPVNLLRRRDFHLVRRHWRQVLRLYRRLGLTSDSLDLRRAMALDNGKSRYFIHVCSGCLRDRRRAEHMADVPRVRIFYYPCDTHGVVRVMARHRFLQRMLAPEVQEQLDRLHAHHFGDGTPQETASPTDGDKRRRIVAIIQSVALRGLSPMEVEASTDLLAQLGLDSLACLEILVSLENEFGVRIDFESVAEADFRSVTSLEVLVQSRLPTADPASRPPL